jgi:MFS family permease
VAQFEATVALLTDALFGMSVEDNFLVFALMGAVLMVAGGAYRPLARKGTEQKLLRMGVVLMIVGLAGLAGVAFQAGSFTSHKIGPDWLKPAFYLATFVTVSGFAFVNPSVSALVSKRSDPARQGEVLGVNQAFSSLGRILGPLAGSVLFQMGSSRTLPYLAGVVALLLVAAMLPRVRERERTTEAQRHREEN